MDMDTIRCTKCNGTKTIAPMGGIKIECPQCQGVGYIMNTIESTLTSNQTNTLALNPINQQLANQGLAQIDQRPKGKPGRKTHESWKQFNQSQPITNN